MTPAARVAAAIAVLDEIVEGQAAEQALTRWARASRFAGSKDRAAVRDHVFDALRHWRSDPALGGGESGRARMIGRLRARGEALEDVFSGIGHAPEPLTEVERSAGRAPQPGAEAGNVPDWLWTHMERDPAIDAQETAANWQIRAPITIRANLARTSVEDVQAILAGDKITTEINPRAKAALTVTEGERRLRQNQAFLQGAFELQDAASQAVVESLPQVENALDYCAGGGGKALAMAARSMKVTAHDVDPRRMQDLPERAVRAGVQIARCGSRELNGQQFDLVLCDAPCSGSGSWRRSPEAKWNLTPDRLAQYTAQQGEILDEATRFLRPDGVLAYATCSVFTGENEAVVEAFLHRNRGWGVKTQQRWPLDRLGDGFFSVQFMRE